MEIVELMELTRENITVFDSVVKADSLINNPKYNNIICSVSGGSDSDILLDICTKIDINNKIKYVYFETGLEYDATRKHIAELEKKYNISIIKARAKIPIPKCCKEYGQPFLSKQVSEWIYRLQKHNFNWKKDGRKSFKALNKKYPNCKAALRWWCNDWKSRPNGTISSYNIDYNKYLKDFMIENPPDFLISNKCCKYAKKEVAHKVMKDISADLNIIGVRRYEGGARATAYKNCFSNNNDGADQYRLIFWYRNEDKKYYEELFGVEHSKCYTQYGLQRTGCAGCPYGRNMEQEIEVLKEYEPNLYKAVNHIFGDSYRYTRMYKEYVKNRRDSN